MSVYVWGPCEDLECALSVVCVYDVWIGDKKNRLCLMNSSCLADTHTRKSSNILITPVSCPLPAVRPLAHHAQTHTAHTRTYTWIYERFNTRHTLTNSCWLPPFRSSYCNCWTYRPMTVHYVGFRDVAVNRLCAGMPYRTCHIETVCILNACACA